MIMNQSVTATSSAAQRTPRPYRRPASIEELAARAQNGLYDDRRDLKHHLRTAEKNRRTAKELHKMGDLEAAFVEYAKAATLVLEKLPSHRDYSSLTKEQQRNLSLVRLLISHYTLDLPHVVWSTLLRVPPYRWSRVFAQSKCRFFHYLLLSLLSHCKLNVDPGRNRMVRISSTASVA